MEGRQIKEPSSNVRGRGRIKAQRCERRYNNKEALRVQRERENTTCVNSELLQLVYRKEEGCFKADSHTSGPRLGTPAPGWAWLEVEPRISSLKV